MNISVEALAFVLLAVASIAAWAVIERRWRRRRPLIEFEPRRPVPWRLLDFLAIVSFCLFAQIAATGAVHQATGGQFGLHQARPGVVDPTAVAEDTDNIDSIRLTLVAQSIASLVGFAFAVAYIRLIARGTWPDLGFRFDRIAQDVSLGLIAFAAVSLPIFALQAALSYFFPTRHPIVEMLEAHREAPLFVLSIVSAVVIAPVVEEFLFRVLWQGWLESVWLRREQSSAADHASEQPRSASLAAETGNPFQPPAGDTAGTAMVGGSRPPLARGPIVISSLVFALMHWGHGPAPFALFWFSLALGYLYQRTHRIWPSIVAHASLNAFSLGLLWVSGTG
ncbi:MAG: CPBP family intramembrane glutamic endopeptidase [Pirellulales bacterium]